MKCSAVLAIGKVDVASKSRNLEKERLLFGALGKLLLYLSGSNDLEDGEGIHTEQQDHA